MKFNVEKCAVIHIGHKNNQDKYSLGDTGLESVAGERDLGVYMDHTLKFSQHCNNIASQANSTLGLIKRTITSRNKDVLLKLYKALVRPKLDYCAQVYSPFLKKDIAKIEQVQQRATKMISECRGISYHTRRDWKN